MAMVAVSGSSLQADSEPKSGGLVKEMLGFMLSNNNKWRCSVLITVDSDKERVIYV